ncbi:MAG TPA: hypothetical protein VIG90_15140 [Pedomonas sp.]|uniref:hypothetical protein n=1 Tax=Pedomonas sp. TaxID=2976421 RepID=UPI002F3EC979
MLWKDALTLGLAVLGAVLGVMNTWNAISQRRLRLRVRPAVATAVGTGFRAFSIEVINLSSFAVTISEVGIVYGRARGKRPRRAALLNPSLTSGGKLPIRLEPREAFSAHFNPGDFAGKGAHLGLAYAATSCGEIAYGDSPALKQLRQALRP